MTTFHLRRRLSSSLVLSLRPLSSLSSPSLSSSSSSSELAKSLSETLISHSNSPNSALSNHLSLHFSHIPFTTSLFAQTLSLSSSAGRSAVALFRWAVARHSFHPSDAALAALVAHLGRRHDFPAVSDLLTDFRRHVGAKTLTAAFDRLARAGRPAKAVNLFRDFDPDRDRLAALVSALADAGHGPAAEKIVNEFAGIIFPDDSICCDLIRAWCNSNRLDQANRLLGEMIRGGFNVKTDAYNSILGCVSRLCLKKDPLRLESEFEKVTAAMAAHSVPKNAGTFCVIISGLCKIRQTETALKVFEKMEISPDSETYKALIRSLYQAARVSEGDEMVERMRSAGLGKELGKKDYYGFVKILCGIERVDHAMKVFRLGKGYGFVPGEKTYGLLVENLWRHGQICRARGLMKEAAARGIELPVKEYGVDERFVKKKEKKKAGKKRLSLPEKMERKRKRLRKLRLSFVRKPKGVRRAY